MERATIAQSFLAVTSAMPSRIAIALAPAVKCAVLTLIYRLLRWGQAYIDEGAAAFENRYRQHRLGRLAARAKELGYQLTPVPA